MYKTYVEERTNHKLGNVDYFTQKIFLKLRWYDTIYKTAMYVF